MKALQLKKHGIIIAQSKKYAIYNFQELNDKKRYFNYLVELRGIRICLVRRINEAEFIQYKAMILKENQESEKQRLKKLNRK
jgi:hypothetical protein